MNDLWHPVSLRSPLRPVLGTVLSIGFLLVESEAFATPALTPKAALSMVSSPQSLGYRETGLAAVYADARDGHITASGQIYDKAKLTTAHKTLPFGTKVKVTNPKNNKSVILLVNDRGPVQNARILDVSSAAASRLGFSGRGVHEVTLEVVEIGSGETIRAAHQ